MNAIADVAKVLIGHSKCWCCAAITDFARAKFSFKGSLLCHFLIAVFIEFLIIFKLEL